MTIQSIKTQIVTYVISITIVWRPLRTTFCGFGREILFSQKFWKFRNTGCIAGFSKRIVRAKDPSKTQKGSF